MKTSLRPNEERIRASLRFGAYLLVIVSGIALFLTQKLYISSSILLAGTVFAMCFIRRPRGGSFWEIASFLYLLFFFADWFWITRSLAPSLVHLFIFIMINKLFNLHTDRDYYQLYLLTFLSVLAASSLSVEIEMLGMIVLFVLVFVWNIMSMTLVKVWSKMESEEAFPFSLFNAKYWGMIGIAVIAMITFALGIFYILPRTQLGYFGAMKPGQTQHVSGFSQKVQLGDIAQISENTGEVMRIRVTYPSALVGHRFYWRGFGFDRYDGKSWSTSNRSTNLVLQDATNFYVTNTNVNPDALVKQEIYVAPIDSRVIFGQDRIVRLDGNFFAVSRDVNNTLQGMGMPEHYDVYSLVSNRSAEQLRALRVSYSENLKRYYTKLPDRNSRINELAHEITKDARTVYDQALMVQTFLEKNYQYTTTNLPLSDVDPVSTFLFSKKMGHCEYFATSMVILLRYLGIPCRLVNGFLEGEYNEIGDFYIVRQSHAHTWVEVYFGSGMWETFDPSPRSLQVEGASNSFWRFLDPRKIVDSLSFFWDRYILIFSAQDQIDMLSSIRDRYRETNHKLREKTAKIADSKTSLFLIWKNYRVLIIAVATFLLTLYFIYSFYKRRRARLALLSSPILFYQQMLLHLQSRGLEKPPATTPAEFAEQVSQLLPDAKQDVASITDLFYKSRFGSYQLNQNDHEMIESALSRLSQPS